MTIAWSIVLAWFRTSGAGLVAMIPKQVWYGLAISVAVLYFAHWNQQKGRMLCQAEVRQASQVESDRVRKSDQAAIKVAEDRASKAEQAMADRQKGIEDVNTAARRAPGANNVCIPASVVDRLRRIK